MDAYPKRVEVMGVPIDPYTISQTVERTRSFIESGSFAHLVGVNADKILQMRDDPRMDAIVRRCEIVNADGASMVMAAKRFGVWVPERVPGIDLMYQLLDLAQREGYGVYLLGAKPEVLEAASSRIRRAYPCLSIVGMRDGYFPYEEYDQVAQDVSDSGADIVLVGITSPKKEALIERFRDLGMRGAYVGVGGSFDVASGLIPRAPLWMQRMGLEWVFRMIKEPRRLFKRYMIGNVRFMKLLHAEAKHEKRAKR